MEELLRKIRNAFVQKEILRWLLLAVLSLFILEVLLLPVVVKIATARYSEETEYMLTYADQQLLWDANTPVNEDGVAELNLFNTQYANVNGNGDKVIAPGTSGGTTIRLRNHAVGPVTYTVVLYRIRTNDLLAVDAVLEGENLTDATEYTLPDLVEQKDVIRAVTGELEMDGVQSLDISWEWVFSNGVQQDQVDTALGSNEEEQVTIGVYVSVEDEGKYVQASITDEDNGYLRAYLTLMGISMIALGLLLWQRYKENNGKIFAK